MMDKPKKHCTFGTYKHTISMPIQGRRQGIDFCIHDIVAALNAANLPTAASCCGHNKIPSNILLEDGRSIAIFKSLDEWKKYCIPDRKIPRKAGKHVHKNPDNGTK